MTQAELDAYRYHEKVANSMIAIFWSFRKWLPSYMVPDLSSWGKTGERGLALIAKDRYIHERQSPTKRVALPPLQTWTPRQEHERPSDKALDRAEARRG